MTLHTNSIISSVFEKLKRPSEYSCESFAQAIFHGSSSVSSSVCSSNNDSSYFYKLSEASRSIGLDRNSVNVSRMARL
jgi:hypothetical protein